MKLHYIKCRYKLTIDYAYFIKGLFMKISEAKSGKIAKDHPIHGGSDHNQWDERGDHANNRPKGGSFRRHYF